MNLVIVTVCIIAIIVIYYATAGPKPEDVAKLAASEGLVVKGEAPDIYVIERGVKRPVSAAVLTDMGVATVKVVPDALLALVPVGAPFLYRAGYLNLVSDLRKGYTIDVRGPVDADDNPVQMWDDANAQQQRWEYDWRTKQFRSELGEHRCLTATAAGQQPTISTCNMSDAQKWTLDRTLKSAAGLCIGVKDSAVAAGTNLMMGTCDATPNYYFSQKSRAEMV